MKNLILFLLLLCLAYLIGIFFRDKHSSDFNFMAVQHTNICRAIAALIIILQHVSGGFGLRYLTPLGGIGVAMFLVLSGYGLNESYKRKKSKGYWKSKICRVLVPYITICVLEVCRELISGHRIEIPYYWYLDFMVLWYLIFYAVITIPGAYSKRYIILGLSSVLVFAVSFLLGSGIRAEQAVSFMLGVVISDNYKKAKKFVLNHYAMVGLLAFGILLLGAKQIHFIRSFENTALWELIQLLMKLSFAIAFIGMAYKCRALFNNGFIAVAGAASYELYLVHYRLLGLLQNGIAGIVIFLVTSVVGAWVLNKFALACNKKLCK